MSSDDRAVHVEHGYEQALQRRLERRVAEVRAEERERASKRLWACLPYTTETPCDFQGCIS